MNIDELIREDAKLLRSPAYPDPQQIVGPDGRPVKKRREKFSVESLPDLRTVGRNK